MINQLIPDIDQRVSEISAFANKGTHTTTNSEMFELNENSYIIDTPGIKELGLLDIESKELLGYFPEMRELSEDCRFHNCTHNHEPGCAILF